jgi:hypothetical protein
MVPALRSYSHHAMSGADGEVSSREQTVRRLVDAFNRRDRDALLA